MTPALVVPAVATSRKGRSPAARSAAIIIAAASTSMRSSAVLGKVRIWAAGNPAMRAALRTQWLV
jgi:hypothetical protein